jgi:hypothetical protein
MAAAVSGYERRRWVNGIHTKAIAILELGISHPAAARESTFGRSPLTVLVIRWTATRTYAKIGRAIAPIVRTPVTGVSFMKPRLAILVVCGLTVLAARKSRADDLDDEYAKLQGEWNSISYEAARTEKDSRKLAEADVDLQRQEGHDEN